MALPDSCCLIEHGTIETSTLQCCLSVLLLRGVHVLLGCTSVLRIARRIGWVLPHQEPHVEIVAGINSQVHGEEDSKPLGLAQRILGCVHARVEYSPLAHQSWGARWRRWYREACTITAHLRQHSTTAAHRRSHRCAKHDCKAGGEPISARS